MRATVSWISIAPVKGLALVQRHEVVLETFGVRDNRRFHLIDEGGRLVNGKRFGMLVQVLPAWDEEHGVLTLRFPEGDEIAAEVALGDSVTTSFYGRPAGGRFVEGPWAPALSARAGRTLRLVQADDPGGAVDRGDRAGVSLVSTASLGALASAAGVAGETDGRRFRMLFGLDGLEAHEEDGWLDRRVRIGEAVVRPLGNVGRCAVTTQNPETGVPDLDTLAALKRYRDDVESSEPLPFGVWGEVVEPGAVRVGDLVEPEASRA